ncbi:MAG: helix-turn-helix domain-containing protein, partial [bacterium]|nr:helix-turn-helix domain-containing protein [bacterium]
MDAFFEKKFITTKNAEDISGYTSDYLARLARLGKISAKRIGHSWFIEKESLAQFMEQQENRKVDHIRTLTREREEEYSLHQDSRRGAAHNPLLKHVTRNFINPVPISVPQFFVLESSLRSQVRAALVALVIITSSAFVAQAMTSSSVTRGASRFVNEISSVVGAKFGSVPEYDLGVTTVSAADTQVRDSLLLVTDSGGIAAFASNAHDVTSLVFKDLNFSSIQTSFRKASEDVAKAPTKFASRIHTTPILSPNEIVQAIRSSGVAAYSIITTPSVIARALGHSYIVIGTEAYGIINKSFSGYQDIVAQSGVKTFDAAITARDSLALMPSLITRMNLAFGNAVINAAHFAIKADVSLAYWVARTAPESAQTAFMVIGSVGDVLARAADRTPSLATALFLRTTAVPAVLAPEISKNIVEAGYEGAIHFVRAANFISEGYLSTILGAGRLAHEGVTGAVKVVHAASLLAVSTPSFLEDVYLGALGKAALALESSVSQNPAHEQGLLAVVLPTLSIGEQAALFTYEAVHSLFASTSEVLAGLLGSSSDVSIVSNPPSVVLPFATSTVSNAVLVQTSSEEDVIQPVQELVPIRTRAVISSTAAQPTTINSYPTYTTVVRGVSEDLLNQSLASLRTGVLATVAGMIQPVAAQTVTNSTTIQQVNMIQDLSNLIVRNGDFRGGTLANATSVSATTGTFSSLAITGSGTTTASAGIDLSSGCFAVNGTCITTGGGGSGVTSLAATYPLLTTGATGGITISTAFGTTTANSFSSLQQFNANASTTQLTTTGATYLATLGGNVGIGTTTPGTLLSLGNTGANTVNISATATSTFGSGINVLTGCLAVN